MADVNAELAALKSKIDLLRIVYVVLFFGSLVIIALQVTGGVRGMTIPWALSLGGAVATRLVRSSMVNKYNGLLAGGRPAQLQ
jgi:hypothetical protein